MRTILVSLIILFTFAEATSYEVAQQPCELYNDLKHKKNSFKKHLKVGTSYRVMREQSDHYYIYAPNITIPNRWVEKDCFQNQNSSDLKENNIRVVTPKMKSDKEITIATRKQDNIKKSQNDKYNKMQKPKALLFALSWQNAFCQTHRSKKECHRSLGNYKNDNKFVLHGLWPQPRNNTYCGVKPQEKNYDKNHQWRRIEKLDLSAKTHKALKQVMPGVASNLHRHEWLKHGTCYATSAEEYFQDSIVLVNQVNRSKLANFFAANQGRLVTLQQVRFKVDESFGKGSGKQVEMKCRNGLITELWFHIGYGGNDLTKLLKSGKRVSSHCGRGKIDRAGF